MSGPLATASTLLAGISLYAAMHSLFNAYYRPHRRLYLYFALMCIFGCGYIFVRVTTFQTDQADILVQGTRLAFFFAQLLFLALIGFIAEYTNWRPRLFIGGLVIAMLIMFGLNLMLPHSLGYSAMPVVKHLILPWGELVTDIRIHDKPLLWRLQWLIFLGIFTFQFVAAFRLKKSGQREHGNALLMFGGIFFIAILSNQLVNFYLVNFIQVAEFGLIAMIIMMSLYLNRNVRDIHARAQNVEDMWSTLVMNAPNFILLVDRTGNIEFINHVVPGDDRDTVMHSHVNDYLHPDSQTEMQKCLARVLSSNEPVSTQLQLIKPTDVWMDVQMAPLGAGKVVDRVIVIATDIAERIRMMKEVQESEEKFRQLAENIEQVFFIRDLDNNRMLYVSPAYEKIWGRRCAELYNDPEDFITSIHTEDKVRVLQLLKQQNTNGQLFDAEYRIIDKQGDIHWVHARSYPIKTIDGKIVRIAGLVEDITQRKQHELILQDAKQSLEQRVQERTAVLAQQDQELRELNASLEQRVHERTRELKETHEFTEAIVNIVGAVVIVMDRNGVIVRFNHACEHVTGYSMNEALGRHPWDFLLLPEERESVKVVFAGLTAGQFPNQYENYWLHRDGSKRLIAWSNTCITDQDGMVEYVIGTGVDITEQRRAEEALRSSAEKYRALMEGASDIILIADHAGKLVEANSRGLTSLGYTRDEFIALSVKDIHPSHQLDRIQKAFQKLVQTGNVTVFDTCLLTRDGDELPVDINANLIEYQGRNVAVGFMRDIRERKRTEEQNRQLERRHREMLVREVHHRIKNNLQGVIGLLRNSLEEEEGLSEKLVTRAITQISTIAMVHGLQSRFSDGQVRICDITRAIVDQARTFAPAGVHVEFHENVDEPSILVEEEAIPIALIINELITNAVKHIPALIQNKQVIIELKGNPDAGMELLVFNSGATLPTGLNAHTDNKSGIGLDLVRALLPRQHATFSLTEDMEAGGVYARVRLEASILHHSSEISDTLPSGNQPN